VLLAPTPLSGGVSMRAATTPLISGASTPYGLAPTQSRAPAAQYTCPRSQPEHTCTHRLHRRQA
jgi:hypothetical protein